MAVTEPFAHCSIKNINRVFLGALIECNAWKKFLLLFSKAEAMDSEYFVNCMSFSKRAFSCKAAGPFFQLLYIQHSTSSDFTDTEKEKSSFGQQLIVRNNTMILIRIGGS